MRSTFLISTLVLGLAACSDSTGPGGPTTTVTLNACTISGGSGATWYAYQNTGGAWTQITPNANDQLVFDATEKVSIAAAVTALGSSFTQIVNMTSAELQAAAGSPCEVAANAVIHGSVASVTGTQFASISAYNDGTTADIFNPNWSINVPSKPVDVIATRFASTSSQPPDRIIIRRGVVPTSTPIAPLDFSTAVPLETFTATVVNGGTGNYVDVASSVRTETGTVHELSSLSSTAASSFAFAVVPSALRLSTDLHTLAGSTSSADGLRDVLIAFKTPSNKTLTFGPMVNAPVLSAASTSPYLRVKAEVVAQVEYPDIMTVNYQQSSGLIGRFVSIGTTAGYLGGTPSKWELTIPDMTSGGYQSGWGLANAPYDWSVSAAKGPIATILAGDIADGVAVQSATRFDPNASRAPLPRPAALLSRATLGEH